MNRKEVLLDLENQAKSIVTELQELHTRSEKYLNNSTVLEETNRHAIEAISKLQDISVQITDVISGMTEINTPKILNEIDNLKKMVSESNEQNISWQKDYESFLKNHLSILEKKFLVLNLIGCGIISIILILQLFL